MGRGLKWTLIDEWNSRRQASEKVWGFPEAMGSGKTHSCDKRSLSESWCSRAGDETRTRNLLFTRQLRYRLRHASTTAISPFRRPLSPLRTIPVSGVHPDICVRLAQSGFGPSTAF